MEKINRQKVYNHIFIQNKWLGLIDYKTLTFVLIYSFSILRIISFFPIKLIYKLYICINLILPILIFVLININEDCVIDKIITIIKFLIKRKIYVNMKYYAKLNTKFVDNVENYHIVKKEIK